MLEITSSKQFYSVSMALKVAVPLSHRKEDPLIPSSIINNNDIIFQTRIDTVDPKDLEELRKTWLGALKRQKVKLSKKSNDPEDVMATVLYNLARDEDTKLMRNLVEGAALPVPTNYTVSLPMMARDDRKHLITCLIPFQEARAQLLRLEDALELPIRVVRIASERKASLLHTESRLN